MNKYAWVAGYLVGGIKEIARGLDNGLDGQAAARMLGALASEAEAMVTK